jgi:hypothetical protein
MDEVPDARPWSKDANSGCPVDPAEQAWIESSMRWFVDQFGLDAALGDVALPTPEFYPAGYSGTQPQIGSLVVKVCELMSRPPFDLRIHLFGRPNTDSRGQRAVGHYRVKDGRVVIGLDRAEVSDPAYLTAIIAHEIGHVRLLYEERIALRTGKNHERLTDLLTVYLRLGIFTANAALSFTQSARGWSAEPLGYLSEQDLHGAINDGYTRLGYLTEQEFGYALACHCRLRGETEPAWAKHLDPGPRSYLKQGLRYLAGIGPGDDFPTVKATHGRELVVNTGHGSVPVRLVPMKKYPSGEPVPLRSWRGNSLPLRSVIRCGVGHGSGVSQGLTCMSPSGTVAAQVAKAGSTRAGSAISSAYPSAVEVRPMPYSSQRCMSASSRHQTELDAAGVCCGYKINSPEAVPGHPSRGRAAEPCGRRWSPWPTWTPRTRSRSPRWRRFTPVTSKDYASCWASTRSWPPSGSAAPTACPGRCCTWSPTGPATTRTARRPSPRW